jgi:hypothetical protein
LLFLLREFGRSRGAVGKAESGRQLYKTPANVQGHLTVARPTVARPTVARQTVDKNEKTTVENE